MARVVIVQTHVQEYRLEVFDELYRLFGDGFCVCSGLVAFTPVVSAPAKERLWQRETRNYFLIGKRLLWQSGHFKTSIRAGICVLEFNPRILSNWIILVVRRLSCRETIVWGHLFPRAGKGAHTRLIRFAMVAFSSAVNLYTHEEAKRLRTLLPRKRSNVAPNAVMWRRDCLYDERKPRTRLLFVARLIDDKKPMLLLEAFAKAIAHLPAEIRLDFIGEGPARKQLEARLDVLGINDRVALHGEIYAVNSLRAFYQEAIATVSPGYVGLSATQSFGFGVPMLIAEGERHSVEIALCERGFNCDYFESDSPEALKDMIISFIKVPPKWSKERGAICNRLRERYTLDEMCDGFCRLFGPFTGGLSPGGSAIHIGIAWMGLPYYAARVIQEAQSRHRNWKFTIVSTRDEIPYSGVEALVNHVIWVDSKKVASWEDVGEKFPDLLLVTSWPHKAYRSLAAEAQRARNTKVVVMVDNYLRYTAKQALGYFYFRAVLRKLFSAAWVPGRAGVQFLEFLGMDHRDIYTGLYSGDPTTFAPPSVDRPRRKVIFVGQFVRRKGVINLSKALDRRTKKILGEEVEFIGVGPLRHRLVTHGHCVKSFLQAKELADEYRLASALILPSKIDHWGVVVHEAALCGCLLIVSRQCGCAGDLVEHGVNGYVMTNNSVREIRAAFIWLRSLSEGAIRRGRAVSAARAGAITPSKWVDTLELLVDRFVQRKKIDLAGSN